MKLMLTSFGIERVLSSEPRGASMFYRMPPVSFRLMNSAFLPDYELLLLCDHIVMDGSSFDQLMHKAARAYSGVAEAFIALKAEGRIELVDFAALLQANADLLDNMQTRDMKNLEQWIDALRESLDIWRRFAAASRDIRRDQLRHDLDAIQSEGVSAYLMQAKGISHHLGSLLDRSDIEALLVQARIEQALNSSVKRRCREHRGVLREVLGAYLSYVNANLILASELGLGFHDWLDFIPFYSTKFLSVGKRRDMAQEGRKQVEKLFTVAFPELAIQDTRSLLKALNDTRVRDLRQLVDDAVQGKVEFDDAFAKSVLSEVLHGERRLARFRNVVGYVTLPIGLIPGIGTPAQKAVEETINAPVARRTKQKHPWFYMLSEIAESQHNDVRHHP